jgi:general secretion pathway protein K
MIAAMAAVGVVADISLEALQTGRADLAAANAELARARLSAEADAGVAMVAASLGASAPALRWTADGQPHAFAVGRDLVTAQVEDEGGKIPLNFVTGPQIERLFELVGAQPDRAQRMTAALLRLRDGGPGTDPGASGPLTSLDEVAALPEMTPDLYARLAPTVSLAAPGLDFDVRKAGPLALAAMGPSMRPAYADAPSAAGPSPAIDLHPAQAPEASPAGAAASPRLVTVRLEVRDRTRGDSLIRTTVLELTGAPARPVIIRSFD